MKATIVGNLHFDGYTHDFDSWCFKLELGDERWQYIKELAAKAEELEVYEITVFDAALEVFAGYIEEEQSHQEALDQVLETEEERTECVILHVSKDSFRYTGVLKHDCYTFCTGSIYFSEFIEKVPVQGFVSGR